MTDITLYTAKGTGGNAVLVVANEIGVPLNIVHYDTGTRTLSNGKDFRAINPLSYVPVLEADDLEQPLTEAGTILAYLADRFPESGMMPTIGSPARREADRLMLFNATEIAQKQIPMLRRLLTKEGWNFHYNKVFTAYQMLDAMLGQEGRPYLMGENFTAVDAFVWATMWVEGSTVDISPLKNLTAYRTRIEDRPSVKKAYKDLENFTLTPISDPADTAASVDPAIVPTLPTV